MKYPLLEQVASPDDVKRSRKINWKSFAQKFAPF